ncbi:MAG: PQ-loop repeat-containing protein [Candidatus Caenarcaniphilales bacterium]|nr:PQ-loop repeat-containing protein [Candidatus Caenarcaniphilales bacterium]
MLNHSISQQIGNFTLNISTFLYLVYLLPQLFHNRLVEHIKKLSLLTHSILFSAYILDLVYAFGRSMPWQYKLVSCIGLVCLLVQHFQFLHFSSALPTIDRKVLKALTFLFLIGLAVGIYLVCSNQLSKSTLVLLGSISQIGWLTYVFPQIYKNYVLKSGEGLSLYFILFILLITLCDTLSAWFLDWDLPNKIGSPLSFGVKLILLLQFFKYSSKSSEQKLSY